MIFWWVQLPDSQATIWRKNIPEKLNPMGSLIKVHDRRSYVWLKTVAYSAFEVKDK